MLSLARWQPWAVESTGIQCGAGLAGSRGLWRVRGYSAELGSLAAMGCGEYGSTTSIISTSVLGTAYRWRSSIYRTLCRTIVGTMMPC
eukprot:COSAG03_NODE_26_length_19032_cov_87.110812_8_plen_88_part_00